MRRRTIHLYGVKQQMQAKHPINDSALFIKLKAGQKCHQRCKEVCESLSSRQMKTFEFHEDTDTLQASLPKSLGECRENTPKKQVEVVNPKPTEHRQAAVRPKSAVPGVYSVHRAPQDNSAFHRTTAHGRHRNKNKESNHTGKFSAQEGDESDSDEEDEGGFSSSRHGKDIYNSAESESTMAAVARSQTSDRVPKKGHLNVVYDDKDDTDPVQYAEEGISNMSLSKRDKNTEKADQDRESSRPSTFKDADGEDCVICMDTMKQPMTLPCGHKFCTDCIEAQFQYKEACPICGIISGDQPDGKMDYFVSPHSHCAGYEDCGRIQVTYSFSNGEQQSHHPSPGKCYKGIRKSGYLPDNKRGREVLEMLKVAFDRKLVFTIGNSRTTGQQGVITWNDIHHKTDPQPHTPFGYPDPTYLDRVVDELKAKGVTTADIPREELSRSTRSHRL